MSSCLRNVSIPLLATRGRGAQEKSRLIIATVMTVILLILHHIYRIPPNKRPSAQSKTRPGAIYFNPQIPNIVPTMFKTLTDYKSQVVLHDYLAITIFFFLLLLTAS